LGSGAPLRLFGEDYPTPDGTCVRDYIHVCDIADAHLSALAYMDTHTGAHVFNLGSGTGYSVREVIETARRVTGKEIPVVVGKRREGDPAVLVADSTRVQEALRWESRRSLEDQVRDAWRWALKNR
jgi:UDP-glucose 4-epimerase